LPRRKEWRASLFCLCLLGLAISGCGGEESIIGGGRVEPLVEPAVIEEITVWHTYSDVEALKFQKSVIPEFERQHPDIRVNAIRKPYESIKGGLISKATSSSGPDVVRLDMVWIPEFAKLGLIQPVDGYPEFAAIRSRLYPMALETSKYNGRYYGIPLNLNTKAAIYNRKLLRDAGYDHPPRTMDELIALSRKSHRQLGIGGYHPWGVLPYFTALGGKLTDKEYTKAVGYLDSPESIRAVQTLKTLVKEEVFAPDATSGKLDRWQAVQDGGLLMIDEGPWYYSILSQLDEANLARLTEQTVAAPFPHNPGGKGAIIGGESLVLMKGSTHVQAAWTFIKWMSGVPGQRLMFETGLIPTNVEAANDPRALANPAIRPFVESLDESFLRPPVPNWNKIDKEFSESFDLILRGEIPVESGLQSLAARVEALL
jgi:multiple sugar transport system substrate-binding protein